jgi:hypothetical protein
MMHPILNLSIYISIFEEKKSSLSNKKNMDLNYLRRLRKIKKLYEEGTNIMDYLRNQNYGNENLMEAILVSYDIQSGTYTRNALKRPEVHENYSNIAASILNQLPAYNSILEVGVGEASTFSKLLPKLNQNLKAYGFDLSWSRVKYAKSNCIEGGLSNTTLFTGDIFNAPIIDRGVDVVYTFHSLEPNGGKEKALLKELLRITSKYLLLFEPIYELASEEGKKRMEKLNYVKNLKTVAEELHCKILDYRLLDYSANPLNPTGLILIEKEYPTDDKIENPLACPVTK